MKFTEEQINEMFIDSMVSFKEYYKYEFRFKSYAFLEIDGERKHFTVDVSWCGRADIYGFHVYNTKSKPFGGVNNWMKGTITMRTPNEPDTAEIVYSWDHT